MNNPDAPHFTPAEVAFLEKCEPHEKAAFEFLKNLLKFEKNFRGKQDEQLHIVWEGDLTTQTLLNNVLSKSYELPIEDGRYHTFTWLSGYVAPPEANNKWNETHKSLGSTDIRLYYDHYTNNIKFLYNMGSMSGIQKWWEEVIGNIDFPMYVEDRNDNKYLNPACTNKSK
jgi:hypothetical protein